MTYHAKVFAGGKIVIPADLRREFGIKEGDTLVVDREPDGGLSIKTFEQVVRDTQREARAIFGADYTVEQFVRENRADWGRGGLTVVVDAAAAMALMLEERGADVVAGVIKGSLMTAINVSECCSRGVERGASVEAVLSILRRYEVQVIAFDLELALEAARLREPSKPAGAESATVPVFALAKRRSLPLYTADTRLSGIADAVGVDVRQIR